MAIEIATLVVKVRGDTTELLAGFAGARKSINTFAASVRATSAAWTSAGAAMSRSITAPLAILGGFGVTQFAKFDNAMTQSLAIMTGVNEEMREEMRQTARTLAEETTFSAGKLAKSYFFLASAGLNAQQSVKAIGTVARFAQAGMFDMSRATSLLAGSQAALSLKVADAAQNMRNMGRISDVLVKANRLADATTEQFGEALTRAGGTMKAFGIGLEEGVAVLAVLAERQRKAEVGGEALARVLRLMIPAANKNAEAYARYGVAVFDTVGNIRNMADILEDLENAFANLSPRQKSAALEALGFQRRMQGAILPIIGTSAAIRKFEAELRNAGGTTKDVADNQLKSFISQLIIAYNKIKNAAAALGEELAPVVRDFAKDVANLVKGFRGLSANTKATVVRWGLWLAIMPLIVLGIGKIIGAVAILVKGVVALSIAVNFLIGNPMTLLIAGAVAGAVAIASLGVQVVGLYKDTNTLASSMSALDEQMQNAFEEHGTRSIEGLRRLREEMGKQIAAQKELEAVAAAGMAPIAEQFVQDKADIDAQITFQNKQEDFLLRRMALEKQINTLLQKRSGLEKAVANAQEGSKEFFELRSALLDVEDRLSTTAQSRIDELLQRQGANEAPKGVGAVDAGSLEAYQLRVGRERRKDDKVEKNTYETVVELNKLVGLTEDVNDAVRDTANGITVVTL